MTGTVAAGGDPNGLEFKAKPQLAAEIVTKLLAEWRCRPWVTGDQSLRPQGQGAVSPGRPPHGVRAEDPLLVVGCRASCHDSGGHSRESTRSSAPVAWLRAVLACPGGRAPLP